MERYEDYREIAVLPSPKATKELPDFLNFGLDSLKGLTVDRLLTGWTLDLHVFFTYTESIPLPNTSMTEAMSTLQLDFPLWTSTLETGLRGLERPLTDIKELWPVIGLKYYIWLYRNSANWTHYLC